MFENINILRKKNLAMVKKIYDGLYNFFDHKDLYCIIELFNKLYEYLNDPFADMHYIDFCSENEVIIKTKNSKDVFTLTVLPSLDNIEAISLKISDDRHEEKIDAQFNYAENKIILTEKWIARIIQDQELVGICNMTVVKTFVDKMLRYTRKYETKSFLKKSDILAESSLSEIFIDLDRYAVKRTVCLSDSYLALNSPIVNYYETEDKVPNNAYYKDNIDNVPMNISTEEKFNGFINANNNFFLELRR